MKYAGFAMVLLAAALLLLGYAYQARAEGMHMHKQETAKQAAQAEGQSDIEDAGNAYCPVGGEPVDKNTSYVYEGKRYYFCCPGCIPDFQKEPEKYIEKMQQDTQ